jgi:hypothetical protein
MIIGRRDHITRLISSVMGSMVEVHLVTEDICRPTFRGGSE